MPVHPAGLTRRLPDHPDPIAATIRPALIGLLLALAARPGLAEPAGPADPPATQPEAASGDAARAPEVVVTGSRDRTRPADFPGDVAVIGEDRMRRPGLKNFTEAINDVPGVKIRSTRAPRIRQGRMKSAVS